MQNKISIPEKTINDLGYSLSESQPHIGGERFLMSKTKMVLMGNEISSGNKVAIKVSDILEGQNEIIKEKNARDTLSRFAFAENSILFPKELYFGKFGKYLFWVTEFIDQEEIFVARPIEEQFFLTLSAFQAQESFHATTYKHLNDIKKTFQVFSFKKYADNFAQFGRNIVKKREFAEKFEQAENLFKKNERNIDRFANHLIHTDFVPHNFRVKERRIFMLDCSSVAFGNKYEGWARFLNYMLIHNPELEILLSKYLMDNRDKDEILSLKLMRLYKISFLLDYYNRSLEKTAGDLHELISERISLWQKVFECVLADTNLPADILKHYLEIRSQLRSEGEKERQKEFAIA